MRRYVEMAEDQLYRRLRHRAMEQEVERTPDGMGEFSLPSDFVALIGVMKDGDEVPHQSSVLSTKNPSRGAYYFIEGSMVVTSGVDGPCRVRYYRRFPSILSDGDDRYAMLTEESELFINATVLQAMQDLGRNSEYAFELKKLMTQIDEVNERNSAAVQVRRRVSGLAMYSGRIGAS